MHVQQIQGRHFSEKRKNLWGATQTSPRAWSHFLLLSCYLALTILLSAANPSAICRQPFQYLPIFAAIFDKLPLFAGNDVYRKLPIKSYLIMLTENSCHQSRKKAATPTMGPHREQVSWANFI